MPLYLTHCLSPDPAAAVALTLSLTAEERIRSRHYFEADDGTGIYLKLPRGTMLRHGDLLQSEDQTCLIRIVAKPEAVLVVTAKTRLDLLRAAYHLGNRHVKLEIGEADLRFLPDSVLQTMLEQMGLIVTAATLPFEPETGAYSSVGHHHSNIITEHHH